METFEKHLHNTRVEWMGRPGKKKLEAIATMQKIDSDAVVKMKTIGRKCVSKGIWDKKELAKFFEYVDVWLEECGQPPGIQGELAIWQKIAVMTYAHALAP
jgi:hypothetical protein